MKSTITKEQLLKWGMVITEDPVVPMKKVIGKSESDELGSMSIAVTMYTNTPIFSIILPDGGTLHLNPACIEDLKKIEELIVSYEPVW